LGRPAAGLLDRFLSGVQTQSRLPAASGCRRPVLAYLACRSFYAFLFVVLRFLSFRRLFGMAGRLSSRPLLVDSGPGGDPRGSAGPPNIYKNNYIYIYVYTLRVTNPRERRKPPEKTNKNQFASTLLRHCVWVLKCFKIVPNNLGPSGPAPKQVRSNVEARPFFRRFPALSRQRLSTTQVTGLRRPSDRCFKQ
jgi:hypothetical protein